MGEGSGAKSGYLTPPSPDPRDRKAGNAAAAPVQYSAVEQENERKNSM